jgi:RNA recognition motif-containing protein
LQRPSAGFTLVYGNVPGTVTPSELLSVFEGFGPVLQVVPFAQRRDGPRSCRGCGLVVMGSEQDGVAAMQALHGVSQWPGAERPMSVQPYTAGDRSLVPLQPSGTVPVAAATPYGGGMGVGPAAVHYPGSMVMGSQANNMRQAPAMMQMADDGTSWGARELFLGNLPLVYTENEVLQLLQAYGSVVQLQLLRNPQSGAFIGQARAWYASPQQADAARQALHGTMLLTGGLEQPLPLVAVPAAGVSGSSTPRVVVGNPTRPGGQQVVLAGQYQQPMMLQPHDLGHMVQQPQQQVQLVPPGGYGMMDGYPGAVGMAEVTGQRAMPGAVVQTVGWDGQLMPVSQAESVMQLGGMRVPIAQQQQQVLQDGRLVGPSGTEGSVHGMLLAGPGGVQVAQMPGGHATGGGWVQGPMG